MKILMLDIETKPTIAYVWKMWDENIAPEQIIEEGGMICFCAHWYGEKDYMFFSDWKEGHPNVVKAAHKLLSEADAVVTYNGDKFDLPKLRGEFLRYGLDPIPPVTSIDLIKTVKKLGFVMNRLGYIGPLLRVGAKIKHEGFALWRGVMEGNEKSQRKMEKYCKEDVKLLTRLYTLIFPYIHNHPHLADTNPEACGACESTRIHNRGFRRTKYFKIQRLQCQDCGSWQDGQRVKI